MSVISLIESASCVEYVIESPRLPPTRSGITPYTAASCVAVSCCDSMNCACSGGTVIGV